MSVTSIISYETLLISKTKSCQCGLSRLGVTHAHSLSELTVGRRTTQRVCGSGIVN